MAFEIGIEMAGHFTSGFFREVQGRTEEVRIETDLDTLGSLMKCIVEGAKKFGCDVQNLLKKTQSMKLQTPEIVAETLSNKKGARVGLVVSKGYEKNAYFEGKSKNPVFDAIVDKEMVIGIEEEINVRGEQVLKPGEEEVKDHLRYLLEFGSGIIVVSFHHSTLNPANERFVKRLIESDYPRHYLGAVPVLVSTEYSSEHDDYLRTHVALLNAYTWFNVDRFFRRAETLLRQHGFSHGLLVTQADGEVVDIPKVTPLKTYAADQIGFIKSMYDDLRQASNS
jgi:N-methylhydantoinase A/acetophenone carboxylase